MPTFFTLVKKDCIKISDSISRILGANLKNSETREISTMEIRDTGIITIPT